MRASLAMQEYFEALKKGLDTCYEIASKARARGLDPELNVEIKVAEDLASRVESLVGLSGIASRIKELAKLYPRERLAIEVAKEIVKKKDLPMHEALDRAIRTGLAVLTEGVLVAPLEGIAKVKIRRNMNGSRYLAVYYAGPIRSAGGTAQALSVLIADVIRREVGLSKYLPTEDEIERYKEEIPLYDRVKRLQYAPSAREIELIARNCPVCIDGEATEQVEVSGYKDVRGVETNRLRGGMCLVIGEGLCLKAPKIQNHVQKLGIGGWDFIEKFTNKGEKDETAPNPKYLSDIIAGRPVFAYPSRKGGFRLRYGRCRNTGLAAVGLHPATMYLLNAFLATGTQIKMERPGKAAVVTVCDSIEGPLVLLKNGNFVQVNSLEEAKKLSPVVKKIVDLGEVLIGYGEFLENNHRLMPSGYCKEWWEAEVSRKSFGYPSSPGPKDAFELAEDYNVPLHPKYNFFWHDLSREEILRLREMVCNGRLSKSKLKLEKNEKLKNLLIKLGVPHQDDEKLVVNQWYPLLRCCGLEVINGRIEKVRDSFAQDSISLVSELAGVRIKPKAPTRIGCRMGRPEKAKARRMRPPARVLFPVGIAGGAQRLVQDAVKNKKISVEVGLRRCKSCAKKTWKLKCDCGAHTVALRRKTSHIDLKKAIEEAKARLGRKKIPPVKGVRGLISANKTPEPLEKGVLRTLHDVYVYKDGTCRFDQTNVPLTHFKPHEINTSVKKLKELGYEKDCKHKVLCTKEQILELRAQDLALSQEGLNYLFRVSKYIDDLLQKFYGVKPFYRAEKPSDLVGHLVVGLSPHTSAGVLGRIIGYTKLHAGYAHPFYHASKRRNADGDEDCVILLLDALLNFSISYLPSSRGGLMDAPLVITETIKPSEIDKEALNLDVSSTYPLEFYEKTGRYAHPEEVKVDTVASRLDTTEQYENFGYTHGTADLTKGPKVSAYKTLDTMSAKIEQQFDLAKRISAVESDNIAARVIDTHFLPDILGNLRAFCTQKSRCLRCNRKYRRIPLKGKCTCGGNLVLTVHEGSIRKYLDLTKSIIEEYDIPHYTAQRISLIEREINSVFQYKTKESRIEDFA